MTKPMVRKLKGIGETSTNPINWLVQPWNADIARPCSELASCRKSSASAPSPSGGAKFGASHVPERTAPNVAEGPHEAHARSRLGRESQREHPFYSTNQTLAFT